MNTTLETNEIREYKFYFGPEGGVVNGLDVRPWFLRHILSFDTAMSSKSTEVGIPTRPPEKAQIFDLSGPVRTFTISGVRFDYEEEISNKDFFFKNLCGPYKWTNAYDDGDNTPCYSVGLTSLLGVIQATGGTVRYVFGVYSNDRKENDDKYISLNAVRDVWDPVRKEYRAKNKWDYDVGDYFIETGEYNVALTGIQMQYLEQPGGISYQIKMIECRKTGANDYFDLLNENFEQVEQVDE